MKTITNKKNTNMFTEITGLCKNCLNPVSVLLNESSVLDVCSACGQIPFEAKRIEGLVYIVKNKNQVGVKIGRTEKTIQERLSGLNSTGVPGNFEVVALFPSNRSKKDEEKVHAKLLKFRLAKEHFELEPVEAVLKCYRILNRRRPIFFDEYYETRFALELEIAKNEMKKRLLGGKSKT